MKLIGKAESQNCEASKSYSVLKLPLMSRVDSVKVVKVRYGEYLLSCVM